MTDHAILIDSTICTGCNTCSYRCVQEYRYHEEAARGLFRTAVTINDGGGPQHQRCMHCLKPECVPKCPVSALTKSDYGPVLYDREKCIGCKTCVQVCPFGAPQFDAVANKVVRCSLCAHRVKAGTIPACVEVCPTNAMQFGPYEEISKRAVTMAEKNKLRIYGAREAGGTRVFILADGDPIAAGYRKLAFSGVSPGTSANPR